MLATLGNVMLWLTYAFAALLMALLVYAASQGGALDVATWVISLSVCAAVIAIGFLIRYLLSGNRKA